MPRKDPLLDAQRREKLLAHGPGALSDAELRNALQGQQEQFSSASTL